MPPANLANLDAWDADEGAWNVVIETPKGSRNKYKYEAERGLLRLKCVLTLGDSFPFDFGFIPATVAEDGDPIDVLVLMDEPAFPGCLLAARLIGVIEAEQTKDGKTVRNDRLIAIAEESRLHSDVSSLSELNPRLADQIEHFFISYDEMQGKRFKPIGRHGPKRAEKLVRKAMKDCGWQGNGLPKANGDGRAKAKKR
jgi:inorganic pyrophosphatase